MNVQVLTWCYGCATFLITCRTHNNTIVELYSQCEETVAEMCAHEWVHVTTIAIDGRHWVVTVN